MAVGDTIQGCDLAGDLVASAGQPGLDLLSLVSTANGTALVGGQILAAVPSGQHGVAAAGDAPLANAEPSFDAADLDLPLEVVRRAVAAGQGRIDGGGDDDLGRQDATACP